ncbi:MAG: hypothetical protein KDD25_06975 [Bdellovibrionales bacterium]|nr:hypothetical protein [Bdellovibrionales bacterium]
MIYLIWTPQIWRTLVRCMPYLGLLMALVYPAISIADFSFPAVCVHALETKRTELLSNGAQLLKPVTPKALVIREIRDSDSSLIVKYPSLESVKTPNFSIESNQRDWIPKPSELLEKYRSNQSKSAYPTSPANPLTGVLPALSNLGVTPEQILAAQKSYFESFDDPRSIIGIGRLSEIQKMNLPNSVQVLSRKPLVGDDILYENYSFLRGALDKRTTVWSLSDWDREYINDYVSGRASRLKGEMFELELHFLLSSGYRVLGDFLIPPELAFLLETDLGYIRKGIFLIEGSQTRAIDEIPTGTRILYPEGR